MTAGTGIAAAVMHGFDAECFRSVAADMVETSIVSREFAAVNAKLAATIPSRMAAGAEDVAGPIVILLDPASRSVAGQVTLLESEIAP